MMLQALHWIVIGIFIAAPLVTCATMVVAGMRRRPAHAQENMITFSIGAMIGVILTVLYAESMRSRASLWQFLLAVYFATAMLLVLRGLDRTLRGTLRWIATRAGLSTSRASSLSLTLVRGVLLISLGLPLVMAGVMVYRPKVTPRGNPLTTLKLDITPVQFTTIDGVTINGWWFPAA